MPPGRNEQQPEAARCICGCKGRTRRRNEAGQPDHRIKKLPSGRSCKGSGHVPGRPRAPQGSRQPRTAQKAPAPAGGSNAALAPRPPRSLRAKSSFGARAPAGDLAPAPAGGVAPPAAPAPAGGVAPPAAPPPAGDVFPSSIPAPARRPPPAAASAAAANWHTPEEPTAPHLPTVSAARRGGIKWLSPPPPDAREPVLLTPSPREALRRHGRRVSRPSSARPSSRTGCRSCSRR